MTEAHFNGLTPAEAERLAMLAEEAAEVVQIVGKILRHGYESYHPKDQWTTTNRVLLGQEVNDLLAVLMLTRGDFSTGSEEALRDAVARKLRYAHHQTETSI